MTGGPGGEAHYHPWACRWGDTARDTVRHWGPAAWCTALGPAHSHTHRVLLSGLSSTDHQGPRTLLSVPTPSPGAPLLPLVAEPRGPWQPRCSDCHQKATEAGRTRSWAFPESDALNTALGTCYSAPTSDADGSPLAGLCGPDSRWPRWMVGPTPA